VSEPQAKLASALADRYEIERELGRGGMATVYLARDLKHHRHVAIKVIRPDLAAALGAERFLREIEIVAGLRHPHILPLYDSGDAQGHLYYVMPFAEGETLRARLEREKQLPVADALRIVREVADALAYAHEHSVVHRDIKPENILLEASHAVVADFGIARAVGEVGGDRLTSIGVSLGTPTYMSPEQATGEEVDARSDLYSLACVLFELLAGQPPYTGSTVQSVISQHVTADVPDVSRHREVDERIRRALQRALAKSPAERFQNASEFAAAFSEPAAPVVRRSARRRLVGAGVSLAALAALVAVFAQPTRVLWARARIIPAIQAHVASGDWEAAHRLAIRADALVPNDSAVAALRDVFAGAIRIEGQPAGARVYRRTYASSDDAWELIGTAPIEAVVLPRRPVISEFRFEADGYETAFDIGAPNSQAGDAAVLMRYALQRAGTVPAGMVLVTGGTVATGIARLDPAARADIADFFLDRLEVTNREYQQFVDSGGYQRRELWTHPLVENGQSLTWEAAGARFVDRTGRPGPSTWEGGRHPRDQAEHPVAGVSWYEAAAYAAFRGKRLPNVFEWARAARFAAAGAIIPASNISLVRDGSAPVGSFPGIGGAGAMDLAGNVREWVFNESIVRGGRYVLGGGWDDPSYTFFEAAIHTPFDRSRANGIRLARSVDTAATADSANRPVEPLFRDYSKERPVSDEVFRIYRRQFSYDALPLDARVDRSDTTDRWIRQRVSYASADGMERIPALLFLPRKGAPPFQTAVFFPGSNVLSVRSSEQAGTGYFDFLVENGRAVIYPIYRGTYERDDGTRVSDPDSSNAYRQRAIRWQKEVSRTVDYLASRSDVDTAKLAFLGISWGGRFGGIVLAIEPRFKAAVLNVAGLNFRDAPPEVDDLNYLPHVRTPVLMLNGRHDNTFPLATAAEPMFGFLGTAPEHKRHVIVDGVHYVPRNDLIRETMAWLDRYLGSVR
jgi:tRNA A-37 threonylcarbamoyl transferase component Bud32/dienelactone hydrolase